MSATNDGGPAFPVLRENDNQAMPLIMASAGMSLRDWFAGQALVGLLSNDTHVIAANKVALEHEVDVVQVLSEVAGGYADAMLRAREAKP